MPRRILAIALTLGLGLVGFASAVEVSLQAPVRSYWVFRAGDYAKVTDGSFRFYVAEADSSDTLNQIDFTYEAACSCYYAEVAERDLIGSIFRIDGVDQLVRWHVPLAGPLVGEGAVDSLAVLEGAVYGWHVADGTLTGADVQDGSLGADDLGALSVGAEEIQPGAVAGGNLADPLEAEAIGSTWRSVTLDSLFAGRLGSGVVLVRAATGEQVTVKAPDDLAAAYSFLLPGTAGSNGQYLTRSGATATAWSSAGAFTTLSSSANTFFGDAKTDSVVARGAFRAANGAWLGGDGEVGYARFRQGGYWARLGPGDMGLNGGGYNLDLPGWAGNNGDVLTSNGDGTTSWENRILAGTATLPTDSSAPIRVAISAPGVTAGMVATFKVIDDDGDAMPTDANTNLSTHCKADSIVFGRAVGNITASQTIAWIAVKP